MADKKKVIAGLMMLVDRTNDDTCEGLKCCKIAEDALELLKEQEAVVHPEPSCEMTYITDCCCDLCGVQLIREDNFCRCCGKRIEWKER